MLIDRRAAALAVAAAVPLVLLTALVVLDWRPLAELDDRILLAVRGWATGQDGVVSAAVVLADVLHPVWWRILLPLLGLLLWRRGLRGTALWVVTGTALELATVTAAKFAVGRLRPEWEEPFDVATGGAFPSGHASAGALVAGVAIVLAARTVRRRWLRVVVYVAAVLFALLLGLDRIVLGVHHVTDVLASYLLVTVILAGLAAVIEGAVRQPEPAALPAISEPRKARLAVVMNPIKVPDPAGFRRMVTDTALAAGWDTPMWFETTIDDAGRQMTHAALTAGADVVAAAGGDGTVRVVASELARTGVALGILPVGTGNLLARNLGLPLQLDPALTVVLRGQDRAIDLVLMSGDGMEPDRFAVMGGLGLDAAIMQGAPDELKKKIGWPAYFVAGIRHMRDPAVRVEVTVDDQPPVRHRARTVVIGNVGTLTGGIPLLPDATPDDGLLDVVVVAPPRFLGWLTVLWRVLTRQRRVDERLDRMTGKRVVVKAAHETPRQMDGDPRGRGTEIAAEVEPGVLLVRVPR